jgi:enamine deaminase RidA (YjgF/YER057c/UK114 family)
VNRERHATGTPWEPVVGYSRAERAALKKVEAALAKLGATLQDVVRTRMYVVHIDRWKRAGRAHGEFFKGIRPATGMVEVSRLIAPEILVEIEADAVVES